MSSRLFSLSRGGYEEVVIHGEIVIASADGIEFQSSPTPGIYPARSLLKPFQFVAGGLPRAKWQPRHAACLGSLSAAKEQVDELQRWYATDSAKLSALKVPVSYPYDESHRCRVKAEKAPPSPWFHTCFAKHMGILEACEVNGWEFESYTSPGHPYQRRLLATLSTWLETSLSSKVFVEDGCTLPSPALSIPDMARLYQKLVSAAPSEDLGGVARLMLDHPMWVAGPKQLDTKLMELNPGRLIVKSGADGLLALALPQEKLGIIVKITPGFYPLLLGMAVVPILERFGLKHEIEYPRAQTAQYFYRLP